MEIVLSATYAIIIHYITFLNGKKKAPSINFVRCTICNDATLYLQIHTDNNSLLK